MSSAFSSLFGGGVAVADLGVGAVGGFERRFRLGDGKIERVALAGAFEPAVLAQGVIRLKKSLFGGLKLGCVGAEQNLLRLDGDFQLFREVVQLDLLIFDLFLEFVGFKFREQIARLDFAVLVDHPEQFGAVVRLERELVLLARVDVAALQKADHEVVAADFVGAVHIAAVGGEFLRLLRTPRPFPGQIDAPVVAGAAAGYCQQQEEPDQFPAGNLHFVSAPLVVSAGSSMEIGVSWNFRRRRSSSPGLA
ncbi:MAG: hypothetical protein L6W00_12970 [Lentisphaeria bacterium]|nr:MAG: hypothetical protein L6W00_12970 [Lentisphaeria bacterium]